VSFPPVLADAEPVLEKWHGSFASWMAPPPRMQRSPPADSD
jgi:hypothetical protein